jgi:hypothetical protein
MDEVAKSILVLRKDALARGMDDLAIVYGWSAIRLYDENIGRQITQIELYRLAK